MDASPNLTEHSRQTRHYTALSRQTGPATPEAPEEPLLAIHDIQGNVLPGFNKPHQYVLCFRLGAADAGRQFLQGLVPHISTLEEVLAFRRLYRQLNKRLGRKPKGELSATFLNVAFSHPGLAKLTPDAALFESEPFRLGLAARSPLLGDPTDPDHDGSPAQWVIGGPETVPDVLVIIGGDRQEELQRKVAKVKADAETHGLTCLYDEEMNTLESDGITGREHFGFKDGISQPGVRGRLSDLPNDFLQERHIDPSVLPDSLLYGYPGQFLSWPGEFVFGYPAQTLDPLIPGPVAAAGPAWAKNGSFLVFRRYRQDVRLFWQYMQETAADLDAKGTFPGMTPEKIAAMLMGRWQSGAPFARVPHADNKELGADRMANNYFRFASDSCPVKTVSGYVDKFPQAQADPIGLVCPMAGHTRKVNTRDASNDAGGTLASFQRRILRRGLPFGPPLANPLDANGPDPANGERGLIFFSYQTSIEDQFEFLRNRWMSNRSSPRNPAGDDIAIGLNGNYGQDRERQAGMFDDKQEFVPLKTDKQWITPTGGGYFFSPSLSALKEVLAGC